MKKKTFSLLMTMLPIVAALLLTGCQSKEEKADELIRKELFKTLYDFESYQPIETTIKEAKLNLYNDTAFWRLGAVLAYSMDQSMEHIEKSKEAENHMNIWGPPTAYSSSYSDRRYYEYRNEYMEHLEKALEIGRTCKSLAGTMRDSLLQCDTTQVIGWEVSHRFRCKTRGGNLAIGDYRYIVDKDFENIILREDKDDDDDKKIRAALGTVLTDYWDQIN